MIELLLLTLGDGALIHSMDDLKVRLPKEKARTEVVDGKAGKAVKFSYDEGCTGAFCMTSIRGTPEWDQAAGFSFWVKGDG
ncbi:MAG TPA: carbohydrate binding domain-containing protein, partial [Planctomycetota bacterium]|nr:carbohydrate binding domain-containing protein [Planctomycetota bacterium]